MSAIAASTVAIDTPERAGDVLALPVAATTLIPAGVLVALNAAGNAVNASDAAALLVVGRSEGDADNSVGNAGDIKVVVKRGVFRFRNSDDNAVDADDKGKPCFVESNQAVAETSTHKCKAGVVVDVDEDGVWVDTRRSGFVTSTFTALAALTSTNGTMAAAADDAATKAEGEKIGDDVRAVHATVTDLITALQAAGILK